MTTLYAQLLSYWVQFVLQVSKFKFETPFNTDKSILHFHFYSNQFLGSLLSSCLYYVVYSLYTFIRSGCIDDDYLNNVTDIELLDRTHKDMLDHDPYYDPDQPSTSYN